MAAARVFLFGSRDVWFVVGLPVFLYSQGWRYMEVAGFVASWTIGYGLVPAVAPSVIRRSAFAVISSLHSYLILAYAGSAKAAEDVGFYYAANADGRLIGILLSGWLTQAGGMASCLWGSAIMLALCLAITFLLPVGVASRPATA